MINRLVLWGGTDSLDSLRHIWRHYHHTAPKLGIASVWLPDNPESRSLLRPGDTVIVADVCGHQIGEAVAGVNYVIHNFDGSHELCQSAAPEALLRLQVWTNDAFGQPLHAFRQYDAESRILFQPWGTDLLAEQFYEPVFNPFAAEVPFVGAVWSDLGPGYELGNKQMIADLQTLCRARRLSLHHHTHISDSENIRLVREGRLAPAFTGAWQAEHNYLPCRVFKNISYGTLGLTNVMLLADQIGCPFGTIEAQLDWALSLKRGDYVEAVKEQQQFVAHYTYRESIQAIDRSFQ